MNAQQIAEAEQVLAQADPKLGALIAQQTLPPVDDRGGYFASLCRSIIGQQVSVAAARAIYGRLEDTTSMEPAAVARLTPELAKVIGLSKQKTTYIQDLARHFTENPAVYNHLGTLHDDAVIAELVQVKGIGVWTAQMFLMFTLARPNVFAPDDVGLQKAIMKLYGYEVLPSKQELITLAEQWEPYKTVASFHLWHSLNNNPV
jgi:DNA-3-methyladenine glycosylase II